MDLTTAAQIFQAVAAGALTAVEAAKKLTALQHKGDLQLAGDLATISEIKEVRGSKEMEHLAAYAATNDEKRWMRMGILLRKHINNPQARSGLKTSLHKHGGAQAVAIAQAVQCGALGAIIERFRQDLSEAAAAKEIHGFLEDAQRNTFFVRTDDNPVEVADTVTKRLQIAAPNAFVLAASGDAVGTLRMTLPKLKHGYPQHTPETWDRPHELRIIFFRSDEA